MDISVRAWTIIVDASMHVTALDTPMKQHMHAALCFVGFKTS